MSTLTSLLSQSRIDLDVTAADWKTAVAHSGELLEDTGATDAAYTTAMIDSVIDNGPYIVVAPGFAFAHARPSEAVHETAMSWVRLAEPVEFGHEKNDPVTLVVALAATDATTHTSAMAQLAKVVGRKSTRAKLDAAQTPEEILAILDGRDAPASDAGTDSTAAASTASAAGASYSIPDGERYPGGNSRNHILTVCGNGLGTSLFLKNTTEDVLKRWGWDALVSVEATDTISAKGKAKDADLILTSGEIAKTLGDPGIPVWVVENFTSPREIDSALRALYAL
ncbi:MAG: PTS sugar transporter subunit IIA [Corynebacterium sp.]|uniref:PTS sugar transporter subunit IIA n=1 Tax=unclassified Corynebacterium TaxID=2624378 RepID=UPI002649ECA8|nr:PTS sugar transporter subunit IIA [Corynebacterium sp.]MDN5582424.1 PTS sugar transporter subunit IIA [Corynebacterium sp.]MDN5719644.1 PTS sugar transporter subunit IIA [Corynebacterium sp.]MDN6324846.1 PTS sugar transporter subunit IIA [Corynebacterium sp.]